MTILKRDPPLDTFDITIQGTTWRVSTHDHFISFGPVRRTLIGWVRYWLGIEALPSGVIADLAKDKPVAPLESMHIMTMEKTGPGRRSTEELDNAIKLEKFRDL